MSEDNFFNRWSKRKGEVRAGRAVASEAPAQAPVTEGSFSPASAVAQLQPATLEAQASEPAAARPEPPAKPLPDIASLTGDSDFSPFMARGVDPQLKTTALKKLFTDPRYNVQDGLDTYIADYSQPDPIPPAMLRQMVQSKLLGLFDEEERQEEEARKAALAKAQGEQAAAVPPIDREVADDSATLAVTQCEVTEGVDAIRPIETAPPAAILPTPATSDYPDDDHLNLQLQPDHAAGRQGVGGGA